MVLANVVCLVGVSSGQEELEHILCSLTYEPLKSHAIVLGHFRGHGTNGKAMGSVVVSGDWWGLHLWVAHFLKRGVVRHDMLSLMIEGSCFWVWSKNMTLLMMWIGRPLVHW